MQNKVVFYFHFDVFIFDNKVGGGRGMQLDGQFARCPAAVECPEFYIMNLSIGLFQNLFYIRVISLLVVHSTRIE